MLCPARPAKIEANPPQAAKARKSVLDAVYATSKSRVSHRHDYGAATKDRLPASHGQHGNIGAPLWLATGYAKLAPSARFTAVPVELVSMQSDPLACLCSWADELAARAHRVRSLIGSAHWLSDGHHKEYILKEFLQRHLPREVVISRGFIRPQDPELPPSREIDLLVSSPSLHPPWFAEGDLTISPPEAVLAHIHVKTTVSAKELADVVLSCWSAGKSMACSSQAAASVWAGAVFFAPAHVTSREEVSKLLVSSLRSATRTAGDPVLPSTLPKVVATLDGPVFFFDQLSSDSARVRAFECGKLALAVLLADLFEHLTARRDTSGRRTPITHLIERAGTKHLATLSLSFKNARFAVAALQG